MTRIASGRPRLLSVIGARPEIIQAAPLSAALAPHVDEILVHTGQHYDPEMSGLQIADLRLPVPKHNLEVGSMADGPQLAVTTTRVADVIARERPDAVLVRGDTNATLAGACAAKGADLLLFHVEAGLRSYRPDMPEERNRVQTDRISDVLFAPTESARDNLLGEGVGGAVHTTGDVLADVLHASRGRLADHGRRGPYLLATVHRNYNTDDPARLGAVLDCLAIAAERMPVVMPLHPRTRRRLEEERLDVPAGVELISPVTYSEMLALERDAAYIATDSGGVQREAYLWRVPCITLREETEWVETADSGWNAVIGVDADAFRAALDRPRPAAHPPIFGDYHAAERIASLCAQYMSGAAAREVSLA